MIIIINVKLPQLSNNVFEWQIHDFFGLYGEIESVTLADDFYRPKLKYCIIKFKTQEAANNAITDANGKIFGKQAILVSFTIFVTIYTYHACLV